MLIGNVGKLPDLVLGQELRFIEQNTINLALFQLPQNQRRHIGFRIKQQCRGFQTNTRRDFALAKPVIKRHRQQQRLHPAFTVIEACLKQCRRFAGIHRRIIKEQIGHGSPE